MINLTSIKIKLFFLPTGKSPKDFRLFNALRAIDGVPHAPRNSKQPLTLQAPKSLKRISYPKIQMQIIEAEIPENRDPPVVFRQGWIPDF